MRPGRATRRLIAAGGLALLILGCGPRGQEIELEDRLVAATEGRGPGDVVDLRPLFGDEWGRAVIFRGAPPQDDVERMLGTTWPGYESSMREGVTIAILRDDIVVRWAYLPARPAVPVVDFDDSQGGAIEVDHDDTTFEVAAEGEEGTTVLCYRACD